MNIVYFKEKDHKYHSESQEYISVSGLWKPYFKAFDSESVAIKKAFKDLDPDNYNRCKSILSYEHPDFINMLMDNTDLPIDEIKTEASRLQQSWIATSDKGTAFHALQEDTDYVRGYRINSFDGKAYPIVKWDIKEGYENQSFPGRLIDIPDGYVPEHLVKNDEYLVAGQLDQNFIETINGVRYIDIDDWKGLALGTLIPTPEGFIKIEDLKVGDQLYNGLGEITTIRNVSEVHYNKCYKIRFDTNDEIIADHEHKWVVGINKSKQVEGIKTYFKEEVTMTTEELFNYKGKLSIKCTPVKGVHKDLPIDPYVLGLWLADDNSYAPRITCINQEIWKEIKNRGYEVGDNLNIKYNKAEERTILGIADKFKELDLFKNKHIPNIYMQSSYEQRLDLLRGYMDGDGHFNRSRKRCVMETTSKKQALEVSSLVSSLGFKPTTIPFKFKGFDREDIQGWAVNFTPTENPFLARNKDYKKIIGDKIGKFSKVRYIKSIEEVPTVPTKCLAVDGLEKTYLFGENYIKTHNTDAEILLKPGFFNRKTGGFQKMIYPMDHIYETNYWKYAMKISTYANILEKEGFVVRNLGFTHVEINENLEIIKQTKYKVPYKKFEVELALGDRKISI